MSCPGKEHGTNKPPPTRGDRERSKGDTTCPTISQNPSRWHPSWLNKACTTRKDSESEWLAKDNPETNPITIKPETASHMAEQFSWVPLPYCSPPGCPFLIKSLALSAHVSPQTIHFWMLDKSHLGPGRDPLPTTWKRFPPWPCWHPYLRPSTSRTMKKKKILLFISHTVYGTLLERPELRHTASKAILRQVLGLNVRPFNWPPSLFSSDWVSYSLYINLLLLRA